MTILPWRLFFFFFFPQLLIGCAVFHKGITNLEKTAWQKYQFEERVRIGLFASCETEVLEQNKIVLTDSQRMKKDCSDRVRSLLSELSWVELVNDPSQADEIWKFQIKQELEDGGVPLITSMMTLGLIPFWSDEKSVASLARFKKGSLRPYAASGESLESRFVVHLFMLPIGLFSAMSAEDSTGIIVRRLLLAKSYEIQDSTLSKD